MIILYILLSVLVILLAVITARAMAFKPQKPLQQQAAPIEVDVDRAAKSLSGALKIKTVSNEDYSRTDFGRFDAFLKYLEATFPRVYQALEHETINSYSLLFCWKGLRSEKKPVLFMAHYDVVPAEEGPTGAWTHAPFSGDIDNGIIWGRGALDIKCQVIGILEAIETLLSQGFTPDRDIYVTFGHDEEVDGQEGARPTAELLEKRGLDFEFVIDEGTYVAEGFVAGIRKPIALIGICEKGYADIRLVSESKGGHSSTPPAHTALSIVCEGVARLQKKQFRHKLTPPVQWFLNAIGPEMPLPNRIILSNLWLFKGLFMKMMSHVSTIDAMLRTTTAATMASGSPQSNVLPQKAWAIVNFRMISGETIEDLLRHISKVLHGLDIHVETVRFNNPSAVSSRHSDAFKVMEKTVGQVFPDALPTPYIMLGGSDSIKYERVSSNIFRFSPYRMDAADMDKVHGRNECIPVSSMADIVRFYIQLIRNV